MSYCKQCGAELSGHLKFCRKCGAVLGEDSYGAKGAAADGARLRPHGGLDGANASSSHLGAKAYATSTAHAKRNLIPIVIGSFSFAVLIAVVLIVLTTFNPFVPPALAEEMVLEDLRPDDIAETITVNSDWGRKDGFRVTDCIIDFIEDANLESTVGKRSQATVTYENDSYRVIARYILLYENQDNKWVCCTSHEEDRTYAPLRGLSDEEILSRTTSYMGEVDRDPYKDYKGRSIKLGDLYKTQFSGSVVSNSIGPTGGSAVITIAGKKGLAKYTGNITVCYDWNGKEWELVECSAGKEAYQPDYSDLEGTWRGSLSGHGDARIVNRGICYAGKNTPATITIKSIDSDSCAAVIDASYLVHNHSMPRNDQSTVDGDAQMSASDVVITLDPDASHFYQIYRTTSGNRSYTLYLRNDEEGGLALRVSTFENYDSQQDDFILEKVMSGAVNA